MSKKVYVKPYPKEFREQVVKLVQLGDRSALEVAREFEISVDSIRRWVQQAERDQGRRQDGLSGPEREELVRLRREIRRYGWSGRSCQKQRPGLLGRPIRSRKSVRVCESEPGPVSDRVYVPRAGRLPQRLLRVAGAAAEPAGARERGIEPSDHGDPRQVAGNLRGATGARGAVGRGRGGVAAAGGAADAGAGPAGRDASETALHDPQGPGSGRGAGPRAASIRGGKAKPSMGSGHHLRADPRGLPVLGDGAGRVQPQGGGLGDERAPDGGVGAVGAGDGARDAGGARRGVPFRPRLPVHGAGVQPALRRGRHPAIDGAGRQLFR